MKNTILKNLAKVFALLIIVSSLSSCAKKSIGCPTDLKAPKIGINK